MEDGRHRMVLSVAIGTRHIDGHPPRLLRYDRETHPNSTTRQGGAPHVCSKQVRSNRRVVAAKDLSSGGADRRAAPAPSKLPKLFENSNRGRLTPPLLTNNCVSA